MCYFLLQFTKVDDVFWDDTRFLLFAHDIDAEILYTKYSWNAFGMEKGHIYNAGISKQVIKSVSHDQSPCNEKEIGIEEACHEFKVCSQIMYLPFTVLNETYSCLILFKQISLISGSRIL